MARYRTLLWVATGAVLALMLGLLALTGSGRPISVSADTPTPTSTPTSTPTPTPTPAPSVTITAVPATGQTGQQVTFTANVMNSPVPPAQLTYFWTFGDGGSGGGQTTTHTYANPGTYQVQVLVTGSGFPTTSGQTSYQVIASLAVSANGPYNGIIGQPVTFKATAKSGATLPADTVFTWNFGDGTGTATGQQVSHIYTTTGTFTVTLTASSASTGQSGSDSTTATISLTAPFSVSISGPAQGTVGQALTYQAIVSNGTPPSDVVYTWSWGDGSASTTGQTVTHTYASAGTFTITLTAASASNPANSSTASQTVTITTQTPSGPNVTYQPGWNLVGGPQGQTFTQALNPLYTFQAGDTNYETVPNTQGIVGGRGYWAYFTTTTTVTLSGTSSSTGSVYAPPGQYVMIGNPSATQTLTIRGADAAFAWDPAGNQYVPVTTLQPGQGAWVISLNGGTITVGP